MSLARFLRLSAVVCGALASALVAAPGCASLQDEKFSAQGSGLASGCGALQSGEALYPGQAVTSCNGGTILVHQTDGNVVIYRNGSALWASNTSGRTSSFLVMQTDGNLVLYGPEGPLWATGTWQSPGAFLALQDDCNGVIYTPSHVPVWASNTVCSSSSCGGLQHFSYALNATIGLTCGTTSTPFYVNIPAAGYALARANLVVRHTGSTNVTHFWNAQAIVGSSEINWAVGDDVCAGRTVTKTAMGTGTLSEGANLVRILAFEGASPCTDGAVVLDPSSTLDVWVEDPRPECRGSSIVATSYYLEKGLDDPWPWPTSMATLLTTSITTTSQASLRVLSMLDGTPRENPNTTCGAETATLVGQTALDGSFLTTNIEPVPASGGMGHLVMSSDATVTVGPGTHSVSLLAGANFTGPITTGGCCGDAVIAVLRE